MNGERRQVVVGHRGLARGRAARRGASRMGQAPKIVQWDWFDKSTKEGGPWWTYVEEQLKGWGVGFEMGVGWDEAKVPIAISSGVVIDGIQIPSPSRQLDRGRAPLSHRRLFRAQSDALLRTSCRALDSVTKDGEIYAYRGPWTLS